MAEVLLAGTADTKGEELAYLRDVLAARGLAVRLVDLGTRAPSIPVDVAASEIAACAPGGASSILALTDRGTAVAAMGQAFALWCQRNAGTIQGILAIGGGGGTSIACAGMRELPYGMPKLMVSTLASGDTAPFIGISDIAMIPAVTDLAGLNAISRRVLANAANALAGMVTAPPIAPTSSKPAIGLTMFGVTTPCVTAITAELKDRFDCLVFHATGTGGRTMERLANDGMLSGLIDITLTEITDLICGGVLAAGPDRLDVVAKRQIPWVGSLGALDMVNFWAPETIPAALRNRLFYHHNPNVTLMRTTAEEAAKIGRWIGEKLARCDGPWRLLVPEGGFSALDIEGGVFWSPEADQALIKALTSALPSPKNLVFLPCHINDPAFAQAAVAEFLKLMET